MSFLLSAVGVRSLRTPEPAPPPRHSQGSRLREITAGWRHLIAHRGLRRLCGHCGCGCSPSSPPGSWVSYGLLATVTDLRPALLVCGVGVLASSALLPWRSTQHRELVSDRP